MGLDDLSNDVQDAYREYDDALSAELDRETKNELAMLSAALDTDDPGELVRRGIHLLFQTAVESGTLDFHLRTAYDVTYDEYLSGMTYDEMTGGYDVGGVGDDDDRRYQF